MKKSELLREAAELCRNHCHSIALRNLILCLGARRGENTIDALDRLTSEMEEQERREEEPHALKKSEHIRIAIGHIVAAYGAEWSKEVTSLMESYASEMEHDERTEAERIRLIRELCPRYLHNAACDASMFENRKRSAPFSDFAKRVGEDAGKSVSQEALRMIGVDCSSVETQTKPGVPCGRKHAESVWMFNELWKDLKEDCGS